MHKISRSACYLFAFAAFCGAFDGFSARAQSLSTQREGGRGGSAKLALIHDLQGKSENPTEGTYAVEGIVIAVFPGLGGFFLQEEDTDADHDPETSEGIFVEGTAEVRSGQKVRVEGTVANTYGLTRFIPGATVAVQGGGELFPLPTAVTPQLPVPAAVDGTPYLERFEGMLVTFPGRLYVVDNYHPLGQYGEIAISPAGHLFHSHEQHRSE